MRPLLALLASLVVLALPAEALAGITVFKTPSGNIGCAFFGPKGKSVRCDVRETDDRVAPRPASCDLDYGHAFGLTPTGRGRRLCVGDTVLDPGARVLGYGHAMKRYGIRCTSRETGLRCVNRRGHGFSLSRGSQKVF